MGLFIRIAQLLGKKDKKPAMYRRKRQWGAERRLHPLSNIHDTPTTKKIASSRIAIILTIIFWLLYVSSTIIRQLFEGPQSYNFTMEAFGYLVVVTFLTFSALMYLVARQGAFQRFSKHIRVPRAILDKHFTTFQSSITVLVPAYAEEPDVIKKTLLSAVLQEYPRIRVVLLVDDNPTPKHEDAIKKISATRKLGQEIQEMLSVPLARVTKALEKFERNSRAMTISPSVVKELAGEYLWAATWLTHIVKKEDIDDHVDVFFTEQVLGELANDLQTVGEALTASAKEGIHLPKDRVQQLFQRLVWIFKADVEVFERKKYISLSHEANKAMNLNSYIGLMGGMYKTVTTPLGNILEKVKSKKGADLIVPDSDFILTLDADSLLLREYCLRLMYFLEQPENARVAVTQTPYSSFRGAASRIERLSGATTDIQHILHQGMSHYGATFWVGANAVIRKKALEEIAEIESVGGFSVKRFIQDRTVIEDTESSIDLGLRGWKLINYPERLSYSATPPDFGSLVVQRRRWANGGLLILPKLWAQIRERKLQKETVSWVELLLRINYMASIAWASFGLIFLLAYPYDGRLLSPLVLLAALPYFLAMAADLKYCGYNYTDIFRIYGFNLILLPVNLAGVVKSMQQAVTAKKIPFARTPKVKNRTAVSLPYVLSPLFIVGFSLFTLWRNIETGNWGNAAFAGFNAFAAIWAIVAYIGIWNLLVDIWLGLTDWLYVEVTPQKALRKDVVTQEIDWRVVLYHGDKKLATSPNSLRYLLGNMTDTKRGAIAA